MLPCQKCGYENELGRIFCHQCGTKLDLSQIKPPSQGGKRLKRRGKGSAKKLVRVAIDAAILGILFWGAYLLVQVPADKIPKPTDKERIAAESRRGKLEMMVMSTKPGSLEITPGEFNAYLDGLSAKQAQGEGASVKPESLRAVFGNGVISVIFRGEVTVAGINKKLCISYTGVPQIKGGHFEFKPVAAQIGELPLHPWILENTSLMKKWYSSMFGGLVDEQRLLERLSSITITPAQATLNYQPNPK
jgi:hypothetical protein